jgi:Xaa-Pro aminopeptidase
MIHYTANNQLIGDGEVVLIDAGCEYKLVVSTLIMTIVLIAKNRSGYATDISMYTSNIFLLH